MKTMIAVPCMDMVHTDFFRSCVGLQVEGTVQWTTSQSSVIYDSRQQLAEIAVRDGFDRVLWLDSDMLFMPDLFRRLGAHLDAGREMVTGLYFSRKPPIRPVIYKIMRPEYDANMLPKPVAVPYEDYPRDSLFPIEGCGMGAVMMTTQLLREAIDRFRLPFFPAAGFGEDFSFCLRARELGKLIWCDSSIKAGHVGTACYDEGVWERSRAQEKPEEDDNGY